MNIADIDEQKNKKQTLGLCSPVGRAEKEQGGAVHKWGAEF
jgi:hypothetical protein